MPNIQLLPTGNIEHPTFHIVYDNTNDTVLRKFKNRNLAEEWFLSLQKGLAKNNFLW
jgi:hypothetical protein